MTSWEQFCRPYAAPRNFAEALYLFDLWTRQNGGFIRGETRGTLR